MATGILTRIAEYLGVLSDTCSIFVDMAGHTPPLVSHRQDTCKPLTGDICQESCFRSQRHRRHSSYVRVPAALLQSRNASPRSFDQLLTPSATSDPWPRTGHRPQRPNLLPSPVRTSTTTAMEVPLLAPLSRPPSRTSLNRARKIKKPLPQAREGV